MPSSPQLSQEELERKVSEAELKSMEKRNLYVCVRDKALVALLKQRDFDYARAQGLFDSEDGDLQASIRRQLNYAQILLRKAKDDYYEAVEVYLDLSKSLIKMRKSALKE